MAFNDYSLTPSANVSIAGINVAEGCPAGNINGAIRQLMADAKAEHSALPDVSTLVTKAAAVFSGAQPKYTGEGALVHWADPALASGRCYVQAAGSAAPSMAEGDLLFEYTA